MSLFLSVHEINKAYGPHRVLSGVSLTLDDRQRIGLVGANGVGKSTLLKIIAGEIEADSGVIRLTPGARCGYLAQAVSGREGQSVEDLITEMLRTWSEAEAHMRALEERMASANGDLDAVMAAYSDASEAFERAGGYGLEARIDEVLGGLGVGHIDRTRIFSSLSGGEKSRVGLAMMLLGAPDVLLLDEPTNHLDAQALNWLESYLRSYPGGILIVSHDRTFLNRTVTAIIEIDEHTRTARRYAGNYDAYQRAKTLERAKWREDYARQQEDIKALQLAIKETARQNNNYRAHTDNDKFMRNDKISTHEGTVSKRVGAAEQKLQRILDDPIQRPPNDLRFDPDFDPTALHGRLPLIASGLYKHYGERMILHDVSLEIGMRSRIVLVGPNGAGKSTLLRILVGAEAPDVGRIVVNPAVQLGYLDQESAQFDPAMQVFQAYREGIDEDDQPLKAMLLGVGLFRYDDLGKRVGELSAGQRRKLQIARLMARRVNLLVLDEPTNDVSFDVLEGLEAALKAFPGPVIAASHDRRFIEQFGGEIWRIQDGMLQREGVPTSE